MEYNDFKGKFKELVSEIEISNEAYELVLAEAKLFFIKDRLSNDNSIPSKNKEKLTSKPVTKKKTDFIPEKRNKGRYSFSMKPSNRERLREMSLPEGFRSDSLMLSSLINTYKKGTYSKDSYHRDNGIQEKKSLFQFNLDEADKYLLEALARDEGFKSASEMIDFLIETYKCK
ncbi:hypothetical protein BOVMAS19_18270 [Streptococcus uberis]